MVMEHLSLGELEYEKDVLLEHQEQVELMSILSVDDKEKFVEWLNNSYPSQQLLVDCMHYGARECARVLIVERGLLPPHLESHNFLASIVFSAACGGLCDPLVIDLLIKECGYLPLVNDQPHGVLPIHKVLRNLRVSDHIKNWTVGQSIFKLLILLCLPETRPILDSLKLLAHYTKGLEEIACFCAKDGGLPELTALLLVARDKVLVPMSGEYGNNFEHEQMDDEAIGVDISDMGKDIKCVRGLHLGLTISQHIIFDLGLPTTELDNSFDESYEVIETSLKNSLKMLQVFEKAGDAFDAYFRSDQSNVPPEQVIISIGLLLKKAGFNLEYRDIDLTHTYSFNEDAMKHICKKLEITGNAQPKQENEEHKLTLTRISNTQMSLSAGGSSNQRMVNFIPDMRVRPILHGISFPSYRLHKSLRKHVGRVLGKFYSSWRLPSASRTFMTNTVKAPVVNVSAQRQLVGNSSMRKITQVLKCLKKGI